jgi:hypothetical protein
MAKNIHCVNGKWYYRFTVAGQMFHGPCETKDKLEAERIAAAKKSQAKAAARAQQRGSELAQRRAEARDLLYRLGDLFEEGF